MSGNPFSIFAEQIAGKIFGSPGKLELTAFGKHPGWDDHIYDLPVETEALVAVRQYVYTDGIGSIIDSGEWDKLAPGERIDAFNHSFFWLANDDLVVGRIWSSVDGKGRSHYPMIVCAHITGSDSTHLLNVILENVQRVELACKAAPTAEGVRLAIEQGGIRLLEAIKASPPSLPAGDGKTSTHFEPSQTAQAREELLRACYAIESQLNVPGTNPGKSGQQISLKLDQLDYIAQHIRLPMHSSKSADTALFWNKVIQKLSPLAAPCLYLAPHGETFIDLIAGKPGPQQLVCLRESEAKIPCVSAIPYQLTSQFKASVATLLS